MQTHMKDVIEGQAVPTRPDKGTLSPSSTSRGRRPAWTLMCVMCAAMAAVSGGRVGSGGGEPVESRGILCQRRW